MSARAVLMSSLVFAACTGEGTGAIDAQLYVRQCTRDANLGAPSAWAPYHMTGEVFVAEPFHDPAPDQPMHRLSLRMNGSVRRPELTDALLIRVSNLYAAAQSLGSAIPIGVGSQVRAALELRNTCPLSTVELELEGDAGEGVTFTRLGTAAFGVTPPEDFMVNFGDRVAGEVHARIVDRRALAFGVPADVEGRVDATFEFLIEPATAAHAYP